MGPYQEKQYRDESEIVTLAKSHRRDLFGEDTIYFDIQVQVASKRRPRITDGLLLDFRSRNRPKFWIVEYELSSHDMENDVEPQLRGFAEALKNDRTVYQLSEQIHRAIMADPEKVRRFKELSGEESELFLAVKGIVRQNHGILVVIDDSPKKVLQALEDVPQASLLIFRTFEREGKFVHSVKEQLPLEIGRGRSRVEVEDEVAGTTIPPLETYGPHEWVQNANSESENDNRELCLRWWTKANESNDPTILWGEVRRREQDPYVAADRMVKRLIGEGKRPNTVVLLRGKIKEFYRFADIPFKEDLFERRVKRVKGVKREPGPVTNEQLSAFFGTAPPAIAAFCHFLLSTGCDIGEAFQVQVKDIEWNTKPARVKFYSDKSKSGVGRTSFLSSETVMFLRKSLGINPASETRLFGSLKTKDNAYHRIRPYLEKAGIANIGGDGKWTFI